MTALLCIVCACVLALCINYYWEYRIRRGDGRWGYELYGGGYRLMWPFRFKRQPKPPRRREERMWV